LTPAHLVVMNSWHRLCTTQTHIWHWYPCSKKKLAAVSRWAERYIECEALQILRKGLGEGPMKDTSATFSASQT
jgi:hypothetical protein